MRDICLISDTHRKHRQVEIPECDVLIHAGDFCRFEQQDHQTLEDVDCWFAESAANEIIAIGGNHDFPLQNREFRFEHATFLEDSFTEVDGFTVYGSPWCPDLINFAYYATEDELIERWRAIPTGIDILVTHTPPRGILDVPTSGNVRLGCPHLWEEVNRIQPRLHVFGHIHASPGIHFENGIQFVNASIVGGRDLEVRNKPTLLKW